MAVFPEENGTPTLYPTHRNRRSALKLTAMLDLGWIRANLDEVRERLGSRGADADALLSGFKELDQRRREAITRVEQAQASRNAKSAEIGQKKKAGADVEADLQELAELKQQIALDERAASDLDDELRQTLAAVPNLPRPEVPVGRSEAENRVEKVWGERPSFDFPALPHWEIGERLRVVDFERAAKVSGSRFVFHFGQGARLERALANFMLDLHTREHGYTEVLPPFMVNSKSLFGTGQLPKFAEDSFHCDDAGAYVAGEYKDGDHWMIPTAEVPVTNLFRDEVLPEAELPISFCAYSPCFRSEAGSYGKDVRGLIRQHQFQKVSW